MKIGLPACSALAAVLWMTVATTASAKLTPIPVADIDKAKARNPACSLLTLDEAATLLGAPVTALFSSHSIEEHWSCTFIAGEEGSYRGIELSTYDCETPEEARKALKDDQTPDGIGAVTTPVAGLGEGAYRVEDENGTLTFLKGRYHVSASNGYSASPDFVPPSASITPDTVFGAAKIVDTTFAERFKSK